MFCILCHCAAFLFYRDGFVVIRGKIVAVVESMFILYQRRGIFAEFIISIRSKGTNIKMKEVGQNNYILSNG